MGKGLLADSQRSGKIPGSGKVLSGKTGKIQAVDLYISKFSKNFVRIPGWGREISGKNGKNPGCGPVHQQIFKDFVKIPG